MDKAPKAIFSNISYTPVVFVACDKDTGILPGDNGWAPYDPTECEQRERLVIYDEELAEGWTNTDSTESTFEDTAGPVRMGAHSISWYFTPMTARLYFINPDNFESSDYDNFQFWINGNGRFGQQIGIKMIFSDGSTSLEIKINDVLDEGVQPYDWSRAVVPFSLFGVTTNPRSVRGFVLSSISTEYGGRVVIDDVSLGYTLPMCASKTKNIYADGLAKGYDDDMSWGKWEIKSNKLARSSSYSIQYVFISFHSIFLFISIVTNINHWSLDGTCTRMEAYVSVVAVSAPRSTQELPSGSMLLSSKDKTGLSPSLLLTPPARTTLQVSPSTCSSTMVVPSPNKATNGPVLSCPSTPSDLRRPLASMVFSSRLVIPTKDPSTLMTSTLSLLRALLLLS